jgi:hypothetical protein
MRSTMGHRIRTGGGGNETRRNTASEQVGKRKAREKQHEARKKAKGANEYNAPLGAHTPPRERGGGGGGAGGAVAAKAEPKRQTAQ